MTEGTLRFDDPVTLVGAGVVDSEALASAQEIAPVLVAADGGADLLAARGITPAAVIGDFDSLADPEAWRARGVPLRHLSEQDTTDFEKCLYSTEAPFFLGVGFMGGRLDHTLAVLHSMLNRPEKPVVLIGEVDVCAFAPPGAVLELDLTPGAVVSFFPFRPAQGDVSEGLEWPVDGLALAPGVQSGTSNRAVDGHVRVSFDAAGVLIMLEKEHLSALVRAVVPRS